MRIKRSGYLFFVAGESSVFDTAAFLRGELRMETESHLEALSLLAGDRRPISTAQIDLLCRLSEQSWSEAADIADHPALDEATLDDMARFGWLVCDADGGEAAELRRREERLESGRWHPYAALFHFVEREQLTKPIDLTVIADNAREDAARFVERHGPPPPAFHTAAGAGAAVELPVVERAGSFYEALAKRRTTRAFDRSRPLPQEDLAVLLRYSFGCHGTLKLSPEILMVHKTSPSGGSLHPIEAYPFILDVEGLDCGLYHYHVRDHTLEPVKRLERDEAAKLAGDFAGGQLYAGSAHALVLLTARFFRNHWKYRRRSRTYAVMLMDAGHLSQTFYLVAAELGLGAFYTGAVNGPMIERALGLEPEEEGALGICGCGLRHADGPDLGLAFKPFVPRKTVL